MDLIWGRRIPKYLKESKMNLKPLALVAALAMGNAMALNVLTFDTGNSNTNSTVGALGFSMTQVGAGSVADLDFSQFDVIYVAQSFDEFLSSGLSTALTSRAGDIASYLADGGGIVFGSPQIGDGSGLYTGVIPGNPITSGVDLSSLGLSTLPSLPGLTPVAVNGSDPIILAGSLGDGRIVGWNPSQDGLQITDNALNLVSNSITWAAGDLPSVPEPGTFALMGFGLAGILLVRRKSSPKA